MAELEGDPHRMAETIMMLRSYATIKAAVDRRISGSGEQVPDGPTLREVMRNTERIITDSLALGQK